MYYSRVIEDGLRHFLLMQRVDFFLFDKLSFEQTLSQSKVDQNYSYPI